MKRIDLITSLILVFVDYILLVLAGVTSYISRYQGFITRYRPVFFDYPFSDYFPLVLLVSFAGVIIFALSGLYRISSKFKATDVLAKVFLGVSTTILVIIVTIFFQRELFSSRFVILVSWLLAVLYVTTGHILAMNLKKVLLRLGYGSHNVVLIGTGQTIIDIARYYELNPQLGYRLRHRFVAFTKEASQKLLELKNEGLVDEIVDTEESDKRLELFNFCYQHNINVSYVASIFQTQIMNFDVESVAGYPIIQIRKTPLDGWGKIYKRFIDIVSALLLLVVLVPIFLVIAVLIKLDSRGSILVKLRRVGQNGKPFHLYKFRSMIADADKLKSSMLKHNERSDGPLFKMKNDPRITKFGKFLRRSSFDELPQLYNVIKGEMSLIGPRPHEPEEVSQYHPSYRMVLSIRPGITGLSQISGRSNLAFEEEIKLDIFYIENWSLRRDIGIFLRTLLIVARFNEAA